MMPAETRIDSHRRVEILRFTLDFLKSFILLSQASLPIIRFRVDAAHCRPRVEWIMWRLLHSSHDLSRLILIKNTIKVRRRPVICVLLFSFVQNELY